MTARTSEPSVKLYRIDTPFGVELGFYPGEFASTSVDESAREAGYRSYPDMIDYAPVESGEIGLTSITEI